MITDDYIDKLNRLLERMTTEQVRQVLRFAQFIYEDQEPEGVESREDPAERYQDFSQWAATRGIDLSGMEGWGRDASGNVIATPEGD